jgi:hypothetical protein
MFGRTGWIVGTGLSFAAVVVGCTSGDVVGPGNIEMRSGGAGMTAPPDPSYKVTDVLMRTAAAIMEPSRYARSAPASHPNVSNLVVHVGSGGLEVTLHVGHTLTPSQRSTLAAMGAQVGEIAVAPDGTSRIDAWVPASAVNSLAALDFVAAVTPPEYGVSNLALENIIEAEGVFTHHADRAQARGVTGKGVVVGVTSDGTQTPTVNSLALSQARGELPPSCAISDDVNPRCIFGDATPCVCDIAPGWGHEGTAMLEIVHDVAPGANLVFQYSGDVTSHVNALNGLVAAGANVITEDKAYDGEPAFQHGIAATTADNIALVGVPVHATAGNLATSHLARVVAAGTGQGPDGVIFASTPTGCAHTPDNVVAIAPGGDTTFDAVWPGGGEVIVLQWSEPRAIFPTVGQGGFTDLNLYVMDKGLTKCFLQSTGVQANGVGDTIEFVVDPAVPSNVIPADTPVKIVVDVQGTSTAVAPPMLDLRFRGVTPVDRTTAAGSLDPDSNYTSGRVPNVGASSNGGVLNGFSGQGPATLGLTTVCPNNAAGPCTGVAGPGLQTVPEISWVARDVVSISGSGGFGFPGFAGATCPASDMNPEGQCLFGGTSAAAPHSAGCDALIRQLFGPALSPATSVLRLASTAHFNLVDQNTDGLAGADGQGAGLLDCYAALGPPSMSCAPVKNISVDDTCRGSVALEALAAGSFDPEGGALTFTADATGPFSLGTRVLTITGTDTTNLTNACSTVVHFVDTTPPVLGTLPAQLCVLARQPLIVEAPTVTDNCGAALSGTIPADATLLSSLPVTGGQFVSLPVGTHRITWSAADGAQAVTGTETVVVTDPPARRLPNGDMQYAVTLPGRQAYVEAFVQQNGVQNVAGNIVATGVDNRDGTFTYSRVVSAGSYRQGDVIRARFYSYQSGKPGVFTPGPAQGVWFPDVIYGQSPACPTAAPAGCGTGRLKVAAAVASSQEASGLGAARAIDGNFGTRWSSASRDPQWLYVDLGAPRFVNRVVLYWESAASARYELQVSNDAATWTTVFTETNGNGFTDEIAGLNVAARYVRMFSTARTTRFGDSLFEVQVFGDPNPSCQ